MHEVTLLTARRRLQKVFQEAVKTVYPVAVKVARRRLLSFACSTGDAGAVTA